MFLAVGNIRSSVLCGTIYVHVRQSQHSAGWLISCRKPHPVNIALTNIIGIYASLSLTVTGQRLNDTKLASAALNILLLAQNVKKKSAWSEFHRYGVLVLSARGAAPHIGSGVLRALAYCYVHDSALWLPCLVHQCGVCKTSNIGVRRCCRCPCAAAVSSSAATACQRC